MLPIVWAVMPSGLHRSYGADHLHFITNSCYQRRLLLDSPEARDRFLSVLEQTRQRYRFVVVGYVVMPEHIHLLITEPEVGTPSTVMQVLKQRTAHALLPKRKRRDPRQRELVREQRRRAFWQERFYDFNVWSTKKRVEKLRYMHRNPVKRGLVESPEQWHWSSYRHYLLDETGPVKVNVGWGEISFQVCKMQVREGRGTHFVSALCDIKGRAGPPNSAGTLLSLAQLAGDLFDNFGTEIVEDAIDDAGDRGIGF